MLLGTGEVRGKGEEGRGKSVDSSVANVEKITLDDLRRLQAAGTGVQLLDVRTERTYNETDIKALGAIRLSPEGNVAARAAELALPRHDWLVAYCA
jgi:rhodanese-related sulfurtransferase